MKGILFFGLIGLGACANAAIVDDFLTGTYNSGGVTTGNVSNWASAASAAGGIRYTSMNVISNPLLGDAKCRVISTAGVLDVSTDADVDINFTLGYGFGSSLTVPASNPLNLNLTSIPIVSLNFRTNDQTQPVVVTLYTNGGANSYVRTMNVLGGVFSVSPVAYNFDFTSDAALLGDVDGIQIDFDPASGGDFSLNGVQTVPEPASVAALALGAAVLLRRRKK